MELELENFVITSCNKVNYSSNEIRQDKQLGSPTKALESVNGYCKACYQEGRCNGEVYRVVGRGVHLKCGRHGLNQSIPVSAVCGSGE